MEKKLVVVRIGSGAIVLKDGGIDYTRISCLAREITELRKSQAEFVLVTSGSVATGKLLSPPLRGVPRSQTRPVYFAIGQPILFSFYRQMFREQGCLTADLLISRDSFANRNEYFSIRDTIRNLLASDAVPVVGDNYVLNRDGKSFSGNDHLAAYLAGMLTAERVIFLSSVNGISGPYDREQGMESNRIAYVGADDFEGIKKHIVPESRGGGGMEGKVNAAKLLFDLGIDSWIVDGRKDGILESVLSGDGEGTHFKPAEKKQLSGVRKWLCTGAIPKGSIRVSRLGAEVMRRGDTRGSLLARGIEQVSGGFSRSDVVTVCDEEGRLLGYGITKYSSDEIPALLHKDGIIVIHADYFYGTDHGYFL